MATAKQRFELVRATLPNCALACRGMNARDIARTAVLLADEALRIMDAEPFVAEAGPDERIRNPE